MDPLYWIALGVVAFIVLHGEDGRGRSNHAIRQVPSDRRAGIELEAAVLRFRGRHSKSACEPDHSDHGDEDER